MLLQLTIAISMHLQVSTSLLYNIIDLLVLLALLHFFVSTILAHFHFFLYMCVCKIVSVHDGGGSITLSCERKSVFSLCRRDLVAPPTFFLWAG